eukprot:jgi/Ulvmu1/11833/UM080_0044.1
MESSVTQAPNRTSGCLALSNSSSQRQSQKSAVPRTVSIAVTKPSLFGKRPPPQSPSITVKNRTQSMQSDLETSVSTFYQVGDSNPSSSVDVARLHPIFATLGHEEQDRPRATSFPDAEQALSAVCISRLGSSLVAGIGSLPGTPLGSGFAYCASQEFHHGPQSDSRTLEPPNPPQRPDTTMLLKNLSCVSPSAVRRLSHQPADSPAVSEQLDRCLDASQSITRQVPTDLIRPRDHARDTGRPSQDSSSPWPADKGLMAEEGVASGAREPEQEGPGQSRDATTPRGSVKHDAGLCIVPSCSTRPPALPWQDPDVKLAPQCTEPEAGSPAAPAQRPGPRALSPPLMGVITRSWASRGRCGAGDDMAAAAPATPATAMPAPFSEHKWRDAARTGSRVSRSRGVPASEAGAGRGPLAVPSTSLLPHGPVVQDAASALVRLSLAGRGRLRAVDCTESSGEHGSADAGKTERQGAAGGKPLDDTKGACCALGADVGDAAAAWAAVQWAAAADEAAGGLLPAAAGADVSGGGQVAADEAAVLRAADSRSSQLAQYLSLGGWRGGTAPRSSPAPPRGPGEGNAQCEAAEPQRGVRVVLGGQPAVGAAVAGGGTGVGRACMAQTETGRAPPLKAGEGVVHAREEVCTWRQDMEDRAGRIAAEAARAMLAPGSRELTTAGRAPLHDSGSCAALRDRGAGALGRSGRGIGRAHPAALRRRGGRGEPLRGRDDGMSGRFGYGEEEEDASPDTRGALESRSPDVGRAVRDSAEWPGGAEPAGSGCGNLNIAEDGVGWCDEDMGASLLMTGTACVRRLRAGQASQLRSRARKVAVASLATSPVRAAGEGAKHLGGAAAVGGCRAVRKATGSVAGRGQAQLEGSEKPDSSAEADIRSVAQALLANVPGQPGCSSTHRDPRNSSVALAPQPHVPHVPSLPHGCHSAAMARGGAEHAPTDMVDDAGATHARHCGLRQRAAVCSGAAWSPGRGSPTVRGPRAQACAADATAVFPTTGNGLLQLTPAVGGLGQQPGLVDDMGMLWLQGSPALTPALTPEDSFAACAAVGPGLQGESSCASAAIPLAGEAPRVAAGRPGRLRRGGAAPVAPADTAATANRRGLGADGQGFQSQLGGIIRDALLTTAQDACERQLGCSGSLQSVHSMGSMQSPCKRGGGGRGAELDGEDTCASATASRRLSPEKPAKSPAAPALRTLPLYRVRAPGHTSAASAAAQTPADRLCLVAQTPAALSVAAESVPLQLRDAAPAAALSRQGGPLDPVGADEHTAPQAAQGAAACAAQGQALAPAVAAPDRVPAGGIAHSTSQRIAHSAAAVPGSATNPGMADSGAVVRAGHGRRPVAGRRREQPAEQSEHKPAARADGQRAASAPHDSAVSATSHCGSGPGVNADSQLPHVEVAGSQSRHRAPVAAAWSRPADCDSSRTCASIWRAPDVPDASGIAAEVTKLRTVDEAVCPLRDGTCVAGGEAFHDLFQQFLQAQVGHAAGALQKADVERCVRTE